MSLNCEAGPEGTNIMDDVRNLNAPSVARRAKAWIARVIPLSTIFKVVTGCALLIRPTQTQYASSVCRISAAHPANPLAAQISSSRSMSIASVCAKNWNVRMELWLLLSQDSGICAMTWSNTRRPTTISSILPFSIQQVLQVFQFIGAIADDQ